MMKLFGNKKDAPDPQPAPGLFGRMKQAVSRTRESLSAKIDSLVALTRTVDEAALEDLESALLTSDLGVQTTSAILTALRDHARHQAIQSGAELRSLLKQQLIAILTAPQALTTPPATPATPQVPPQALATTASAPQALGAPKAPLATPQVSPKGQLASPQVTPQVAQEPRVTFLVGVNGTGKTTSAGKLAAWYRAQNRTVLLCAADTFRAAAIEQLEVWATRSGVEIIKTRPGGDPAAVLYDAAAAAKARHIDELIVDTAGRLHTKTGLMDELDKMRRTAAKLIPGAPHQVLLVMDATTGQNGLQQARLFTQATGVTGILLTKLDGTAKGGIAVAIAQEMNLPVRFVGVGEQMADLLEFSPEAFVDSLLG